MGKAKIKVATLSEIPEGDIKKFEVGGEQIILYKDENQVYALSNICPHENCYLDENHQMHNDIIECTCHGSQFDVKTGVVILPPAIEPIPIYKVKVEGEDVYIEK